MCIFLMNLWWFLHFFCLVIIVFEIIIYSTSSKTMFKGAVQRDGWGYKSSINRKLSLKWITAKGLNSFFNKGPVHNLHLKISARYLLSIVFLTACFFSNCKSAHLTSQTFAMYRISQCYICRGNNILGTKIGPVLFVMYSTYVYT